MAHSTIKIIGGFLGSGKTTYLNRILSQAVPDAGIALVINEFGSVALDGDLIIHEQYSMMEITGGCLCCSLKADLITGISDIIKNEAPRIIYIEATGLAVPDEMRKTLEKHFSEEDGVTVDPVTVTVDCLQYKKMKGKLRIYDSQFEGSPGIKLTKTDIYPEDLIEEVNNHIRSSHKDIKIVRPAAGRFLFNSTLNNQNNETGHKDNIQTITLDREQAQKVKKDRIQAFCRDHSDKIIRMKGLIKNSEIWEDVQFDGENFFSSELKKDYGGECKMVLFTSDENRDEIAQKLQRYF
ncbi:MAG: GTP-binding protein [Spirochaetales bacterium]|nr:GTP-binding protein [Spirochaetales bacterium]